MIKFHNVPYALENCVYFVIIRYHILYMSNMSFVNQIIQIFPLMRCVYVCVCWEISTFCFPKLLVTFCQDDNTLGSRLSVCVLTKYQTEPHAEDMGGEQVLFNKIPAVETVRSQGLPCYFLRQL